MAALGVRASVQPAHLLDDRDVTERLWPGRSERCFPLRWMLDEGVDVVLGSDAPVSPLDPWLAVAAAVHRSGDEREPWHPEQSITVREALAASDRRLGHRRARPPRATWCCSTPTRWRGSPTASTHSGCGASPTTSS